MKEIICGDALTELRKLTENSIDSIVTDPPYGIRFMGKTWDGKDIEKHVENRRTYHQDEDPRAGFTGGHNSRAAEAGKYDRSLSANQKYQEWFYEIAVEVLCVLKPGGHLLSFGGSRTYHRMACAIEDAGFDIRDQIMWIMGSGFPKSLNVALQFEQELCEYIDKKWTYKSDGKDMRREPPFRSELANKWAGFGTAFKPAHEPICVARKPLSEKTVSENVLKWGTGAINVDECRVDIDSIADASQLRTMNRSIKTEKNGWGMNQNSGDIPQVVSSRGRWPANVIHDGSDEVVGLFPNTASGKMPAGQRRLNSLSSGRNVYGYMDSDITKYDTPADSGSAARFFYCAKASRKEREMGLEGMPEYVNLDLTGGNRSRENRRAGTNRNGPIKARNNHPTVKPLALMRYLVRLVTPPRGLVLDPFMGSGTTGIACKAEGLEFIGIEIDKEYCEIAKKRIYGELIV